MSFVEQTRVLTLTGEEVEETEIPGFLADQVNNLNLLLKFIIFPNRNEFVEVCLRIVNMFSLVCTVPQS